MGAQIDQNEYPLAELTDKLIGLAFKVFNELRYGYPEKVYQQALEIELKKERIKFEREKYAKILYDGEVAGRFFLDFLIEDQVAVELKVRRDIYPTDWSQLINYLKAKNLKVGLLLVFTKDKVLIKRLVN